MAELRELDEVAYVRFASVYRSFADVTEFTAEVERLRKAAEAGARAPAADDDEEPKVPAGADA